MRSPLSGETIQVARAAPAPGVDLAPLLAICEKLEKRINEAENRERQTIADMSQSAMRVMEAALKACSMQAAPAQHPPITIEPDPRIAQLAESVNGLQAQLAAISTAVNNPKEAPASPAPKIDKDAILSTIRAEIAQSAPADVQKSWEEVTVVIGARDANGNIKEFFIKPKGVKS